MPKPVSPVVPGANLPEVVFAKNQPQYAPLPAHISQGGAVVTRWEFTWRERIRLLCRGDLYVWIWPFRQPLQPIAIAVDKPKVTSGGGDQS
jgi:hypothetical protein